MLRFIKGDILKAEVEAMVNTVNCVGVMGRGIALQFKNAFPNNFKAYAEKCKRGEIQPGHVFMFDTEELTQPRYIINFPTKRHWRGKSRIEDIKAGLNSLAEEIRVRNIRSVAIPPLGSGLGGLNWAEVKPLIENALSELSEVEVFVFEPSNVSADTRFNSSSEVPRITAGRAALVALMHHYLAALMDPSISLLEVHKLMYFLQEAGEPLKLRYVKAPYGPYAENLRHVLRAIEGHLISDFANGGNETIAGAFRERLKEVAGFPFVPEPIPMRNSNGAVIYYLFFASHRPVAAKIVEQIFNKYRNKGVVR